MQLKSNQKELVMNKKITNLLCAIFVLLSVNLFAQAPNITQDPQPQGIIAGQTATFQVTATGTALTYQWYKNSTIITGATNSSYTTPAAVLSDNGSLFSVKVTNGSGSDSSSAAQLYVTASGARVTNNLELLYNFNEGSGDVIHDNSGVGTAYDLGIDNPSNVTWTPDGLANNYNAYINADPAATKVINAAKSSNELTVEAWIYPGASDQINGARILTLSHDNNNCNFSMIELNHKYYFKLRTSSTDNSGEPSLPSVTSSSLSLTHFVFTYASDGTEKIYINGVLDASGSVSGNLSNWDATYRLGLANEWGPSRPWLGTYYLVSVYNRALSQAEVQENFNVGTTVDHKPVITIEPNDLGLISHQQATFSVSAVGDTPLSYQWKKNGVNISGANNSSYTTPSSVFDSDNGDIYSVIVSNASGADTSRDATLFVTGSGPRVVDGQILFYNFQGGIGDSVVDSSGYGTPLNLKINNNTAVQRKPYGLIINSAPGIKSKTDASKVTNSIISNGQFTFEAWIKPQNTTQSPATIFTISNAIDMSKKNFTVDQMANYLRTTLRTSTTTDAGEDLNSSSNSITNNMLNIVYTHSTKEVSKIYINGVEVSSAPGFVGDLSNWNSLYGIQVADQFSASQPWKGIINLVSIYNRALDSVEVAHNYAVGPLGVTLKTPGNLTAKTPHARMVQLTWKDSSNNEDGFIIERQKLSPIVSAYEVIDTAAVNDTSFTDLTVSDTTSYKYRIRAYNLLAVSAYSNEVTIKTLLSNIPAPANLKAIRYQIDTSKVNLTWNDNSSNELGFIIQRKLGDSASVSAFTSIDTVGANTVSYNDLTTKDTTKYSYRVYAYNADTTSAYTNIATITTALPVELTSFSANAVNGRIFISWGTATEINNAGFSVERSKDNKKFSEVAFIKGKGTTTEKSLYSYMDKSALSGKYYYRLKQVDLDGSYNYLKSIEIDLGLPKEFTLDQNYPNPFNPSTTIRFALPTNSRVSIKLYNTLGQEVANVLNSNLDAGIHEQILNASNLSSGVYFYRLEAHGTDGSSFISTKRMLLMK
jgi:hypothetical protein